MYSVKVNSYQRTAAVIDWILSQPPSIVIEETLPFLVRFQTPTERRNELARRILRISDDPSIPPPDLQTGMFWLETLAADEQVQREDALQDLCQQLGGVAITSY